MDVLLICGAAILVSITAAVCILIIGAAVKAISKK